MTLKILCVHGIGRHEPGQAWEERWRASIVEPLQRLAPGREVQLEFVHLDAEFGAREISAGDVARALRMLVGSALDPLFGRRERNLLGTVVDRVRWTAGMVVQWVEDAGLRRATRTRLAARIKAFQPDVVVAHSLGTLVAYDTFTDPKTAGLIAGRTLVTCASQIGNPFVIGQFAAGRLLPLPQAAHWFHLHNPEDAVFTGPIRLAGADADNYTQLRTLFDIEGVADHDVEPYMRHRLTVDHVWAGLAQGGEQGGERGGEPVGMASLETVAPTGAAPVRSKPRVAAVASRPPRKRALLVGINEYADPAANLAGCVNDVWLVSAMLQESGYAAEDIRIVLNDRATTAGVIERMDWLLDDARGGDTCFFYYSGHGAQVPTYGADGKVDRLNESLVLHDFDWSAGKAFSDTQFHALYSQLPYDLRLVCLFDCCHAGGMTRAAAQRVRGLNPPDDIRHRMLRWDGAREMWLPRSFEAPSKAYDERFNGKAPTRAAGSGRDDTPLRATHRLGQAMDLRAGSAPASTRKAGTAQARGHLGPYLPTLIYACSDAQFAHEYEHGPIAHGAFTYSLVKTLRRDRREAAGRRKGAARTLSFAQLVEAVGRELADLGYAQTPSLIAPQVVKDMAVPLLA
ncbi:caspase family protein [Sphaerotilus mobilis]|uniref:Putative caspase-like protein n=1 Tax=Sphaerotilus mobilis TaxID=47994 RepID=A0A4Q7LUK4_9BURK|nr:caspase family protein [Sphaerotilus mobilis]RZS57897.1 putative caspase-like protein [Sphaerotilus mobilis]